jgi:ribosome-associated protein
MANAAEMQVAPVEPERLLELVQSSLEDDKAEDLVVVDLAEKSNMADFMVIASGRSTRQVGAMAENLRERLKAEGIAGISVEGAGRCDWVLLDAGDVIVHLFRPEVRVFYNLEKMWGLELPQVKAEEASVIDPLDRPQA